MLGSYLVSALQEPLHHDLAHGAASFRLGRSLALVHEFIEPPMKVSSDSTSPF